MYVQVSSRPVVKGALLSAVPPDLLTDSILQNAPVPDTSSARHKGLCDHIGRAQWLNHEEYCLAIGLGARLPWRSRAVLPGVETKLSPAEGSSPIGEARLCVAEVVVEGRE